MTPIIEMKDIYKSYGKGESRVEVLKGVSLTVEPGEFVAILGPSDPGNNSDEPNRLDRYH